MGFNSDFKGLNEKMQVYPMLYKSAFLMKQLTNITEKLKRL